MDKIGSKVAYASFLIASAVAVFAYSFANSAPPTPTKKRSTYTIAILEAKAVAPVANEKIATVIAKILTRPYLSASVPKMIPRSGVRFQMSLFMIVLR